MDPHEVRLAMAALQEALNHLYMLRVHGLTVPDATLDNIRTWIRDLATHNALVAQVDFK